MKRMIISLIAGMFLWQSCDKFLDLKPENIKVMSTIEDYRDLMASYMRYLKTPNRSQKNELKCLF